jgi:hypothetical protein
MSEDLKFKHPFSCIVSGPSGSGKMSFSIRLLQNLAALCTEHELGGGIIWCYSEKTAVPSRQHLPSNIIYPEGVPENFGGGGGGKPCLVILDDLLNGVYSKQVCDLFTRGSHHSTIEHVALPIILLPAAMASTTSKWSTTDVAAAAAAAKRRRRRKRKLPTVREEQQLPDASSRSAYSDICTYGAVNSAFGAQRVPLRRLFFINANKTKYVSVGFYPARDYLPLVEFGVSCGSKSIILKDEQVYTLAQCLPTIADAVCKEGEEGTPVIKCESGNFRLRMPRSRRGLTRL